MSNFEFDPIQGNIGNVGRALTAPAVSDQRNNCVEKIISTEITIADDTVCFNTDVTFESGGGLILGSNAELMLL